MGQIQIDPAWLLLIVLVSTTYINSVDARLNFKGRRLPLSYGKRSPRPLSPPPLPSCSEAWTLVWSDEFDGDKVDETKWDFQYGNGSAVGNVGWGNNELEWYRKENAAVRDGNLVITAKVENETTKSGCCGDTTCTAEECNFSSARLRTYKKFSIAPSADELCRQYVKVEARIKLPVGLSLWPAFWMLPEAGARNNCSGCGVFGDWAASGAITIANIANDMQTVNASIWYGGTYPNQNGTQFSNQPRILEDGKTLDDYQVFSFEWSVKQMQWFMSNKKWAEAFSGNGTKDGWYTDAPGAGANSPFDLPFHILLNMAVGGTGAGSPTPAQAAETLQTPKELLVDYVRVYVK